MRQMESSNSTATVHDSWQLLVLNQGSAILAAVLFPLVIVLSGFPIFKEMPIAYAASAWCSTIIIVIAAAGRPIPYTGRVMLLLIGLLMLEFVATLRVGFVLGPLLMALMAVVAGGLLLGVRWALVTWIISTLILFACTFLLSTGIVTSTFDPASVDPGNFNVGLRLSLAYGALSPILAVGVSVVVNRLTTSLRETQDALGKLERARDEANRFAVVIAQATEMVLITDKDGTITYVNPAFEKGTGYSQDAVLGKNPSILKSGKHDDAFYQNLWNTITAGDTWAGHIINRRSDGTLYTEEATVTPIRSSTGEIINFVQLTRDITHEIQMEDQLRQAQKMESIGTLSAGIAHDFNNILSASVGFTELAIAEVAEDSKVNGYLRQISKANQRASAMVGQILTFSRQSKLERRTMRMQSVLREGLDLLHGSIPSTIEIREDIDPECNPVVADATEVHQILFNLCTNAYHAMQSSGGELAVQLKQVVVDKEEASIDLDLREGQYARLTVTDSGCGMNQKMLERVFEPYYTSSDVGEGTGLGLSTVHGIVNDLGGAIQVHSELGKGTRFDVFLPSVAPSEGKRAEKEFGSSEEMGNERILLVDDEESIIVFAKLSLERFGYNVTSYSNSKEALAEFRSKPGEFDIVITDEMMPGMRGTELSRKLVAIKPEIPVILFTGFTDRLQSVVENNSSIRDYVMKPVIAKDLARAVRSVLDAG